MTLPINPKLGDNIADSIKNLKDQRAKEGKTLGKHEVGAIIQAAIVGEFARISEKPAAKPPSAKKPAPQILMPDEQWLAELEANPIYEGIDIRRELGKATVWATERKAKVTRRRFINWLAKSMSEMPMKATGIGQSSFQRVVATIPEPKGWREWARENMRDPENADKSWSSFDLTAQKYISSQVLSCTEAKASSPQ